MAGGELDLYAPSNRIRCIMPWMTVGKQGQPKFLGGDGFSQMSDEMAVRRKRPKRELGIEPLRRVVDGGHSWWQGYSTLLHPYLSN